MRNLQYEMRICKKVIIKSQRQFMYGSNFYVSDVRKKESQPSDKNTLAVDYLSFKKRKDLH